VCALCGLRAFIRLGLKKKKCRKIIQMLILSAYYRGLECTSACIFSAFLELQVLCPKLITNKNCCDLEHVLILVLKTCCNIYVIYYSISYGGNGNVIILFRAKKILGPVLPIFDLFIYLPFI